MQMKKTRFILISPSHAYTEGFYVILVYAPSTGRIRVNVA